MNGGLHGLARGTEHLGAWLTTTAETPVRSRLLDALPFDGLRRRLDAVAGDLYGPGEYIYETEWELLVVVDACRYDLFCDVAEEYEFVETVERCRSRESMTRHWMRENFTEAYEAEMERTAYVSGNPISGQELDPERFAVLDEPWRDAWDTERLHTLPARAVTDRAIALSRDDERSFDRLLVHYLQPHCPFVTRPGLTRGKRPDSFTEQSWDDVWMRLETGELDRETVWAGYRENLAYVLEEVGVLLQNVDADRAVITSDHGNAVGEWDLYGHPPHWAFSCLRDVPWVETTARDEGTREPSAVTRAGARDLSIEERLAALGYTDE